MPSIVRPLFYHGKSAQDGSLIGDSCLGILKALNTLNVKVNEKPTQQKGIVHISTLEPSKERGKKPKSFPENGNHTSVLTEVCRLNSYLPRWSKTPQTEFNVVSGW